MSLKTYTKGSELPPLEDGKLRLYSMRFCPYAQRTRLVLAHKKISFETINVDLKQKPDWFLERNPLGLVPVLERDGKIVYESTICNEYLEDVYPQERLTPEDHYRKARDKIIVERNSKFVTNYYKLMRSKGEDKEVLDDAHKSLDPIEQELKERKSNFFGGDKPAMADFLIWPWYERIGPLRIIGKDIKFVPEDRFPCLCAWMERMRNVPAVKETAFDDMTHLAFYKSYATGTPNYDIGL